jgi:hypothetical protein
MRQQYSCDNPKRRQEVRDSGTALNGIDYLEVVDLGAAPEVRQRQLEVYFIKPNGLAGLRVANLHIEGGERIKGITVTDLQLDGSDDRLLHVTLNSWGDFSLYRLRLVDENNPEQAPAGFDPILSEVSFSFKIDCPSDFDCPGEPECRPAPSTPPQLDYLAKDYASFRRLMLDRLSTTVPDWQERNPADGGVAVVEALAYAADHLSYYQDAVATEAYLGTARRRVSLRRHARLLDYHMHEGCNARCWVSFEVSQDIYPVAGETAVLETGTILLTRVGTEARIRSADLQEALTKKPLVFETLQPIGALTVQRSRIAFYTWSDDKCCLPKGATRATLLGNQAALNLAAGDVLVLEEVIGARSGLPEDADPSHRHAVRLCQPPRERIDPLDGTTVVDIVWHAEDALPFPLCLWELDDGAGGVLPVSVARGNVVLADHGQTFAFQLAPDDGTVAGEHDTGLTPAVVPVGGHYRPRLNHAGVTHRVEERGYNDPQVSARATLSQAPGDARPAVSLFDGSERWVAQRDLLNSGRFANEFVVEVEDDGRAYLRFGDGILGKRPAGGTQFAATYRVGNGRVGNVGAEAIAHVVTELNGIARVRNPLPAQAGTDAEPIEQVRLYAPHAFRSQQRAVTEADYASVAQLFPEVDRAVATRRWTGSWYTMFITVDRRHGRAVDADFEARLRQHLEAYRLAGHDVEVDGPQLVSLDIAFTVCVKAGYFPGDVEQALLATFSSQELPDGRPGFFHPDNFSFGEPVYLSRLIATAMQVPGVQWVDIEIDDAKPHHRFQRWGEQGVKDHFTAGRITMERLEIARLDNDPNAPENGRIEFIMEGGA